MRRIILVTGATGKQGSALVCALLRPSKFNTNVDSNAPIHEAIQYHIFALTRNSTSHGAESLLSKYGSSNLTIVQGDLDDPSSVSSIFESAKQSDPAGAGIWGVFAVLAFPGLGANAEGEERQGKLLADVALEHGVKAYLYSSAMRAGPKFEDQLDRKPSGLAKRNVELHCKALGEKGLPWVILRPSFFMENFEGFMGRIAVSVIKQGMKGDAALALIASEDIGNVAAGVFRNHEQYLHKILTLTSEISTMTELEESYQKAAGKPIPAIPGPLGRVLVKVNKATQDLIQDMEHNHNARLAGDYPELEDEVNLASSASRMKTYYEWVKQGKDEQGTQGNWNQVSLWKLLTGRS